MNLSHEANGGRVWPMTEAERRRRFDTLPVLEMPDSTPMVHHSVAEVSQGQSDFHEAVHELVHDWEPAHDSGHHADAHTEHTHEQHTESHTTAHADTHVHSHTDTHTAHASHPPAQAGVHHHAHSDENPSMHMIHEVMHSDHREVMVKIEEFIAKIAAPIWRILSKFGYGY